MLVFSLILGVNHKFRRREGGGCRGGCFGVVLEHGEGGGRDRDERGRQRKKIVRREDLRLETRNEPKSKKEKKPKTRRSKRIISSAIFPSLTIS